MTASFGPCEVWPAKYPCDVTMESPTGLADATLFATEVVSALAGRQFGPCGVTLRPCLRECLSVPLGAPWQPWGAWLAGASASLTYAVIGCTAGCTDTCSCTSLSEVRLPAPVNAITTVKINGSPVVTGGYRLDDNRTLVRLGGLTWPRCNDLTKADTEVGTWSVTATYGQPVPEGGKWAVGELACQLLQARRGEDCRLPRSVSRLVRQGVTIEFPDFASMLKDNLTGLYLVDTFINSVNPNHLTRRSRTYSVDGAITRRVGT